MAPLLKEGDYTDSQNKIPNRLIKEKSPYLLQHAYNPVDWYPWGEEAFKKAKAENKPVFLSIGYSTCHWCHVMARESFEDEEIAQVLNRDFISIKVDKEERQDIDTVYMTACQVLTGQGGWPLTIIMSPEQKPFFAATYLPKNSLGRIMGLWDILSAISQNWQRDKEQLLQSGEKIANFLQRQFEAKAKKKDEAENKWDEFIDAHTRHLGQIFDAENGGFGFAPKFPMPHNLLFLLRRYALKGDYKALNIAEKTLEKMYRGGIFDHIGFGFCRYSTDEKWLAPHFEKMLYDNALLTIAYLEAYQLTGKELYKAVAKGVLEYVLRELYHEEGGFYSAQDADSDGVEGKFYLFSPEEIVSVLGEEKGGAFNSFFDITSKGNFEGKNIPNLLANPNYAEAISRFSEERGLLYSYRQKRMNLHKDDKILTSWNGLMIAAFAAAYRILGEEKYYKAAKKSAEFILKELAEGNTLYISWRENKRSGPGLLDDYAFFIWGLWELYQSGFEEKYLAKALDLTFKAKEDFWDEKGGGFKLIPKDGERLIYTPKEVYDGALPSGNSVIAYVLSRLALLTGNSEIESLAEEQLAFLAGQCRDYPGSAGFALISLSLALAPQRQIAGVFQSGEGIKKMQEYNRLFYEPNRVMLAKYPENAQALARLIPFSGGYNIKENKGTYYICDNRVCKEPVHILPKPKNWQQV